MAKRKYQIDEAKILRFEKEGRGTGELSNYLPWLTIHDVPSKGRCSRIQSIKTGRTHHLLSDVETSVFLIFDFSSHVTDVREAFPLVRDQTRKIGCDMGVKHPADPKSKVDIVMTTDFLVSIGYDGKLIAFSVKTADELKKKRTIEKLEIERRYWNAKGVEWRLVTDKDLPRQKIKNLRWLHELLSMEYLEEPYANYWKKRCEVFLLSLRITNASTIKDFFSTLEAAHGFQKGEALMILRHLAAQKKIAFDLDQEFNIKNPIWTIWMPELREPLARLCL